MRLSNENVWEARIQTVSAVLTASAAGRDDLYWLATACQVGLEPPRISVSPNPAYPICDTIAASGYFGLCFLAEGQEALVEKLNHIDRHHPDKLGALGVPFERTERGTPLLTDCIQAIECRVEQMFDSGDHRTTIGVLTERRVRDSHRGRLPLRFGGVTAQTSRVKELLCRSGAYGLMTRARRLGRPARSIELGTASYLDSPARAPVAGRRRAKAPPGVCLVGLGMWGSVHAQTLRSLGPSVRRFFASRDLARAQKFASRFGGEDALPGLQAALRDDRIDAVILTLPHDRHAEAVRAALDAGKHVLVEKPIATSIADARELIDRADRAGLCLGVADQYRLSPILSAVRRELRRDRIGRVVLIRGGVAGSHNPAPNTWKTDEAATGGGVLLDVGIHYVDVLRTLFGEPERVTAVRPGGGPPNFGGEAEIALVLGFANGPAALLHVAWTTAGAPDLPNLEILGERGAMRLWFDRPVLEITEPMPERHWSRTVSQRLPWRIARHVVPWLPSRRLSRVTVPSSDQLAQRALLTDFVGSIVHGCDPAVPGREGLRDLEVILQAYESLA